MNKPADSEPQDTTPDATPEHPPVGLVYGNKVMFLSTHDFRSLRNALFAEQKLAHETSVSGDAATADPAFKNAAMRAASIRRLYLFAISGEWPDDPPPVAEMRRRLFREFRAHLRRASGHQRKRVSPPASAPAIEPWEAFADERAALTGK